MNIYFISGLGADKRIFKNVELPERCKGYYLDWIRPLKNESLRSYAHRLAEQLDTSSPFIIVGLSFGGMLATEIINKYPLGRMLIISSVPSASQLPGYYRIAGRLKLHKIIPVSLLKSASIMKRFFTAETPEQKAYLKKVIREVDTSFVRWGLDAIVKWQGEIENKPFIHVHGSRDLVLPARYCSPTHVIKGAGHLMLLTRTNEINRILREFHSQLEGKATETTGWHTTPKNNPQ
jgi:pimeloyl-ACP methyl ester carboxylesterase